MAKPDDVSAVTSTDEFLVESGFEELVYQPPRRAGAGRPLHEPVADIPRRPEASGVCGRSGLAVVGPNRTGGSTDANTVCQAFASVSAPPPRPLPRVTADSIVNRGSVGMLAEGGGIAGNEQDDTALSSRVDASR